MNKLLIALTAGLLASSAVFAQAPAAVTPAATPAKTAASAPVAASAVKKHKKAHHKAKAAKGASAAQVDPTEAHQ